MTLNRLLTLDGAELGQVDIRNYTFKLFLFIVVMLALNGCLHTIKNVPRLYLSIEEGRGRGFISIEEL